MQLRSVFELKSLNLSEGKKGNREKVEERMNESGAYPTVAHITTRLHVHAAAAAVAFGWNTAEWNCRDFFVLMFVYKQSDRFSSPSMNLVC